MLRTVVEGHFSPVVAREEVVRDLGQTLGKDQCK